MPNEEKRLQIQRASRDQASILRPSLRSAFGLHRGPFSKLKITSA
jgi:hypothetical protein